MAPEFQRNGIALWAYLPGPSVQPRDPLPDPYGADYVTWGREIARIATQYPLVQGMVIDELHNNTQWLTVDRVREIVREARAIRPSFKFFTTSYFATPPSPSYFPVQK